MDGEDINFLQSYHCYFLWHMQLNRSFGDIFHYIFCMLYMMKGCCKPLFTASIFCVLEEQTNVILLVSAVVTIPLLFCFAEPRVDEN